MNTALPSPQTVGERAAEIAFDYIGLPYVFAAGDLDGPTSGGFDRAGFTRRVIYATTGTDIGRTLDEQLRHCERLPAGEMAQPGDILFWTDPSNPYQNVYHQAFYTGMMTVIALTPEDLANSGAAFELRLSARVQGTLFHEQTIGADLITAQPPVGSAKSELIIARPPYAGVTAR